MTNKVIVVSNETHSLLFSLKNKLQGKQNKNFTYDEVMKFLLSSSMNHSLAFQLGDSMNQMYQLEEKQ